MKCPKCKNSTQLQKRQVGLDDYHEPVYNEFAICKPCKKQWNLDEMRARKAEKLKRKKDAEAVANLRPIGYSASKKKKAPTKPEHSLSSADRKSAKSNTTSSRSSREQLNRKENIDKPVLIPIRMVFFVVSLIGFAYWISQGFRAGLDSIEGIPSEYSGIYIILAICFLVAAVFWWLMRSVNAFFVYFLPMICYLIGAFSTFSYREEASHLLVATVVSAIFSILCLLLAALAKASQN